MWTGGHATPAEAVAAYRKQAAVQVRRRAAGRGQGQDRRLHRRVRDQPGQRRAGPRLHRRLRPDGLRHRRDHGRPGARQPRLRVRARLRAADALRRRAVRRPRHRPRHWDDAFASYDAKIVNSAGDEHLPGRPGRRRGQGARSPTGWQRAASARAPSTSGCATGCSAASATGASPSRSSTTRTASPTRCPSRCCRWSCPRSTTTRRAPSTRTTPTPSPRPRCRATRTGSTSTLDLGDGAARALPPRDQHHAQLGRFLLVRAALPGPAQHRAAGRPGDRAVLDGPARGPAARRRRPVRRRRRARRAAPAVRALLVQGAVRPGARLLGRAVPQAVQPGHDPGLRLPRQPRHRRAGRRGRGARRRLLLRGRAGQPRAGQDGQVPEERRHAGRDLRRVRRGHAAPVRDGDGPAGRLAAVGHPRRGRPVPAAAAAVAQRRRRGDRRGHRRRHRARRGHPARPAQGDRRRRARTWRACASTPPSPRSPS